MTHLVRTNPGLLISLLLIAGCILVCTIGSLIMARNGASLRPVFWFAGFFGLVVVPQFFGHLFIATRAAAREAPRVAALEKITTSPTPESKSADAKTLFGPDADPQLIIDARNTFGAFSQAEYAQFASLPNGETVLLARFNGYLAAEKAWIAYLRDSGLNQLRGEGDSQRGYAVTRPVGDRAYALHMDNMVGVWTGKDDEAIRKRMIAGGFETPRRAPLAGSASAAGAPESAKASFPLPLTIGALAVYLFIVVLYFFKGAAWAGSRPAQLAVAPAPASEVERQLESINDLDVPFRIERGSNPNEFFATWRYADAKWIDLARARGMRRTVRIRLALDERNRVVRATDYFGSYDWSVGRGGANIDWKSSLGIVFFQYEHQRVFGLQLDESGRFKPALSYAYTFNLDEMKSPLIEAVTRAGWTWRPVIWQGPAWLRWLTE